MTKLKRNFVDNYKINSRDQIQTDIYQWCEDIKSGDDTAVRLTDIVIEISKPESKDDVVQPRVIKIQGYQIIDIGQNYVSTLSVYSPLIRKIVGTGLRSLQLTIPYHQVSINCSIVAVGIEPINDDTTKRLMFAGWGVNSYRYYELCIRSRGGASDYMTRMLCSETSLQDPLLAMVRTINSFPVDERKRILDIYDTYGPIDTLVGDALIHIDKFRSL